MWLNQKSHTRYISKIQLSLNGVKQCSLMPRKYYDKQLKETWKYEGEEKRHEPIMDRTETENFSCVFFFLNKTVIVYSLKHIQYLRWMEREISYTEWWSRHDCKLLCNAGFNHYPGTEHTRHTFFRKIRQKMNAAAFLIAKE